jgi:hypothetical protein
MLVGGVKGTNAADIERAREDVVSDIGVKSNSRVSLGVFGGECDRARMYVTWDRLLLIDEEESTESM